RAPHASTCRGVGRSLMRAHPLPRASAIARPVAQTRGWALTVDGDDLDYSPDITPVAAQIRQHRALPPAEPACEVPGQGTEAREILAGIANRDCCSRRRLHGKSCGPTPFECSDTATLSLGAGDPLDQKDQRVHFCRQRGDAFRKLIGAIFE